MTVKRHYLSASEIKKLKSNLKSEFGFSLNKLSKKSKVEVAETDIGEFYLIEGKPVFFKTEGRHFPTLLSQEIISNFPKIVVDLGAVPYICRGADVMAPGIVRIEGEFSEGSIVVVIDEKHGKPISVGIANFSSEEIRRMKKGKVIKNIHYVGDKLWKFFKSITS